MSVIPTTRGTCVDLTRPPARAGASVPVEASEVRATIGLPKLRLRLTHSGTLRTVLDGGWWPRSTDPVAELPGLVLAIDVLRGPITRLLLATSTWDLRPSCLALQDRMLRLVYYVSQPPALLTAVCDNGERVDLLIVPPDTIGAVADAAMMYAASVTNRVPAQHIIATVAAGQLSAAQLREQVWEREGGRTRASHLLAPTGGDHRTTGVTAHEYDR
jgi:Family of unknown function (DUF5994)